MQGYPYLGCLPIYEDPIYRGPPVQETLYVWGLLIQACPILGYASTGRPYIGVHLHRGTPYDVMLMDKRVKQD